MSVTIDNLEIQIQSDSTSAANGIDMLTSSLNKIKNAVRGGIGLRSVINQIRELDTATKSVDSGAVSKIDRLAESLAKLSAVKISSSIGGQIKNISSGLSGLSFDSFYNLEKLGTSLAPLSDIGKAAGLKSIITQLGKLPELANALKSMDLNQFTNDIMAMSNALEPLSSRLDKVSVAFSRMPANIRRTVSATRALPVANNMASLSYINLWAKVHMTINVLRRAAGFIASWVTQSNHYIEDLNLFTISMGKYADEAKKYATEVSEIVGIDPGEWMRNQGIFNTIIKGFGVAEDKAYTMSKNLTQLGYDISSMYDIPFENAMEKLQSGISGELEPLRRLGYDLSVARLQEEALKLGIEEKVSAMNQAEKSELRYHAILTQVTTAQGDMARTLVSPANQLRILNAQITQASRALGNIFLPILKIILPYAIATAKVVRYLADCLAGLFGFKLTDFTAAFEDGSSSMGGLADNTDDATKGLKNAAKAAKQLKNATLGIDELHIISPQDNNSGAGGKGGVGGLGGGGLGIKPAEYNFLDEAKKKSNELFNSMLTKFKEIAPIVASIGAGLAAWKVAKGLHAFLDKLKRFKGFSAPVALVGLAALLDDMKEFRKAFKDFIKNGPNFDNVSKMISSSVGMIADALILLGNTEVGGGLKVIQGVADVALGIKGIIDDGFDEKDAVKIINGISNVAIGIGVMQGNFKLVAAGFALKGIKGIVGQTQNIITAIKTGDWSVIDWTSLAENAVISIIGIAGSLLSLKKLKIGKNTAESVGNKLTGLQNTSDTVKDATSGLNTSAKSLTSKLKSLVKNLGLGIVVIGEVAFAAALIVGAIFVLGKELKAVADAWEPLVGKNGSGKTALKALGLGTALLAAVGLAVWGIGELTVKGGGKIAIAIGVGTGVLGEIGIAAGLFLIEVEKVGSELQKIETEWSPVLEKEETIKESLAKGTALITAVGVATGALGAITLASGLTIPLAIAAGTALLLAVSEATVLFIKELGKVANALGKKLAPKLEKLNEKLPTLRDNMKDFTDYMTSFAGEVVRYTEADVVAGLAATIDTIIGWFTEDPIDKLAKDVSKINKQTKSLNEKLDLAVPELEKAKDLLTNYRGFLKEIETLTDTNVELSDGMFVNMKEVGEKLVTGFVEGISSKSSDFSNVASTLVDGFKTKLKTSAAGSKDTVAEWGKNINAWFVNKENGNVNSEAWKKYAYDIIQAFKNGIFSNKINSMASVTGWAGEIRTWFTGDGSGKINSNTWQKYAKDIIKGFNDSIKEHTWESESPVKNWASNVISWFNQPGVSTITTSFTNIGKSIITGFTNGVGDSELWNLAQQKIVAFADSVMAAARTALGVHSPSRKFKEIGQFVIEGFNTGLKDKMGTSYSIMDGWAKRISGYKPDISAYVPDMSQAEIEGYYTNRIRTEYSYESPDMVYAKRESREDMSLIMREFYRDYVEPTLKEIASDTKRQADKSEKTVVQIGNKTVTDAVVTQRQADGYSFI